MTLTPSYGRDYHSAKTVRQAWESGKDFTVADIGSNMGRQCSKCDIPAGVTVTLRYAKLRKCIVVEM